MAVVSNMQFGSHRKMKRFITVSFLLLSLLIHYCQAELGIGLGYPYLGVKYNFSGRYSSEIKWATGDGINVYAGRGYWNFYSGEKLKGFVGPELGYITFDTLDIKGTGYEGALFIGGECFLTKRLSLALDFSPTLIGLESDDFKVNGVEWVANLSLYYYLWKN